MLRKAQDLMQLMDDMAALELALSALYQACSNRFAEDRNFWLAIAHQEQAHAGYLKKLAALIAAHPAEFRIGRAFNSAAIKTVRSGVERHLQEVRDGHIDRVRALYIGRDIESSVLEAKYAEIIDTDSTRFREIMDRISRETAEHRKLFAAKLGLAALPATRPALHP
jgi:uncharacterized protein (DUF934 family)